MTSTFQPAHPDAYSADELATIARLARNFDERDSRTLDGILGVHVADYRRDPADLGAKLNVIAIVLVFESRGIM